MTETFSIELQLESFLSYEKLRTTNSTSSSIFTKHCRAEPNVNITKGNMTTPLTAELKRPSIGLKTSEWWQASPKIFWKKPDLSREKWSIRHLGESQGLSCRCQALSWVVDLKRRWNEADLLIFNDFEKFFFINIGIQWCVQVEWTEVPFFGQYLLTSFFYQVSYSKIKTLGERIVWTFLTPFL